MGNFLTMENLEKLYNSYSTPTVFTYLASLYIEEGKYEKAIDICTAGLEQHPDYPFAHYILATAYYHTNNFSGAKRELEITLAYEDQFPEAWRLLGMINSNLGLNILTKESALRYYLTNSFSSEAAQKFFRDEYVDVIDTSDSVSFDLEEEADAPEPEPEPIEKSAVNEDIDSIFKEAIPKTEQEEEEKGLDEFFRDSLKDINVEEDLVEKEHPEKQRSDVQGTENGEIVESGAADAEPTPEQDEFTRAMDSFFSDYEEEKKEQEQEQDIQDQPSETIAQEEEGSLTDEHEKETTGEERIDREQLKSEEEEDFSGNPQDKESDNMMDYTAVVADYISENQDKEKPSDVPESLYAEEESDDDAESNEKEENNDDFLEDEPDIFPDESLDKGMPSTLPGESQEDEDASNFGRPPILTSTLGEIYISQGRFEEAYSVFQKLLEKDPGNDRYRRKIKDIQHLIEKHGKKLKKE